MNIIRVTPAWMMPATGILLACLMIWTPVANAQTANVVSDTFTGTSATNPWVPFGQACLTAGGGSGTIPACKSIVDTAGSGALRLTYAQGNQSGAIISNPSMAFSSSQGLQVTFTTYTYGGNSGGTAKDGADGIGFYLLNGTATPNLGAFGGSLGYSCSNTNSPHDGMAGAYLGLGMDEFGNFLNGGAGNDNTATGDPATSLNGGNGAFYQPGRIGLRGYGNVNTANLQTLSAAGYTVQQADVQATCETGQYSYVTTAAFTTYTYAYTYSNNGTQTYSGNLYQKSGNSYSQQGATVSSPTTSTNDGYTGSDNAPYGKVGSSHYAITVKNNPVVTPAVMSTPQAVPDYAVIPNGYLNLPSTTPIANEGTSTRTTATPINYKLQITTDGKLSFWYSYNGGTYNTVLAGQSIAASNGTMPGSFLFGFGASTGGSNNVHEITCFLATPANLSASSAGLNVQQSGEVQTGTQVYLAYYHPTNWWGELTANSLVVTGTGTGTTVSISTAANWDASCVLTGGTCSAMGTTSGGATITTTAQTSRTLVTWSGTAGIPFTEGRLTPTELGWLEAGTSTGTAGATNLVDYLSGGRTNEVPAAGPSGTKIYRSRTSVLGDIIDSGPTWVGPPSLTYPATWGDLLYPTATPPENVSSAQTYPAFQTADATRLNVVYDGANDGFLHAFSAGSMTAGGAYNSAGNNGQELLAYMPQAILQTIHNGTTPALDYSSPNYSHNYFVDATPGTGDLFYSGAWHTWLVSGLGSGGNAIFAIDITDPTTLGVGSIIGEWGSTGTSINPVTGSNAGTGTNPLVCVSDSSTSQCSSNLGQTYGTPQIRRLHNGEWGIIFGNGFNSSTGHAGIYVMTFTSGGALDKVYYLDTGVTPTSASTPDGIAYVTPTDFDGDHITDYVYAGDYYGNVWRFDLTSSTATSWAVTNYGSGTTPKPLFTTPSVTTTCTVTTTPCPAASTLALNQPITTALVILSIAPNAAGTPRIMVDFGTGAVIPQTTINGIQYAQGQQALYGIWDWQVGVAGTAGVNYDGLTGTAVPKTAITTSQLQVQTATDVTATSSSSGQGTRTVSNTSICFVGMNCGTSSTGAPVAGTDYGWYMNLPANTGLPSTATGPAPSYQTEQVIYSPIETEGAFIVNTTVPANNAPLTCTVSSALGWTMGINPATGGTLSTAFFASSGGGFITANGVAASGIAVNATGSPSVVMANSNPYLISQTTSGVGTINQINPPPNEAGGRLTWIELH